LARRGLLDFLLPKSGGIAPDARRRGLPDELVVECAGVPVQVALQVRPNARRMILRLDRITGAPTLTLPRGVGRAHAERFLSEHAGWLENRLAARPAPVVFAAGSIIPVRGEPHLIHHHATFRGVTRIEASPDGPVIIVHGDPAHVGGRVERFLRTEATLDLTAAARRHAAAAGVTLGRITIKDTRSRWGSCSARGDLAFSWRLIFAPPFVLDYLAAHEVAHRLEMNHSTRYWRHVAQLFPRFREAEAWLNRNGSGLHLIGR